jgi:hypothetical protein
MRITDPGEEESNSGGFNKPSNILQSIKAQSKFNQPGQPVEETDEVGKVTAEVNSAKLKALLGQIKTT